MARLLFSLTKKDFELQTFRCSGKGGQNVNKVETGVRIIHPASGARAECCEQRYQHQNKVLAFKKLLETPVFKAWHKIECAKHLGNWVEKDRRTVDEVVDDLMRPEYLKIEVGVRIE